MRTHTLLTRVACSAVCFGVLLTGPTMAGVKGIIKDIQLSADGTLYGQVAAAEGRPISDTGVLRFPAFAEVPMKSSSAHYEHRFDCGPTEQHPKVQNRAW